MAEAYARAAVAETRVTAGALFTLTALAWLYLLRLPHEAAATMPMAGTEAAWSHSADLAATIVMWAVMMIAMMTPSAAPMILTYAALARSPLQSAPLPRPHNVSVLPRTAFFVAGYFLVWSLFSVAAAVLQWGLRNAGLLSDGARATPLAAGALLLLAGAWQLTPLKHTCLARCRSPHAFLVTSWREGGTGAVRMGIAHGLLCVGCCWSLMLLLFVAGAMNLLWVLLLAGWVLLEKLVPTGRRLSGAAGVLALAAGAWQLLLALTR